MEAPLANPTKTATLAQAVVGHTAPIGSKVAVIFSSKTRNTTGCEKTSFFLSSCHPELTSHDWILHGGITIQLYKTSVLT